MENSTPCKIVTLENFILQLGTRDYVEDVTYYTIFDVDCFSGGFSPNRWNITLLWLFPVLTFFLPPTPSSNCADDIHALWLKWRGSAQGWSFLGLGRWVTLLGGMCPKTHQAKVTKYKNLHIIKTTASIQTKFCTVIKTTKRPSRVVQPLAQQIHDGRRPPSWKKSSAVAEMGDCGHNSVGCCSSA